jgi:hypothetical protein
MKLHLEHPTEQTLRTICGREFCYVFKTMKLVRDEQHNFHVVYKTYSDEYIYSYCNPFQDTNIIDNYVLISESEAKAIFLNRLSPDNARELFNINEPSVVQLY